MHQVDQEGEYQISLRPRYGVLQTKFTASSVLPVPLYSATCGYGQTSRRENFRIFALLTIAMHDTMSNNGQGSHQLIHNHNGGVIDITTVRFNIYSGKLVNDDGGTITTESPT